MDWVHGPEGPSGGPKFLIAPLGRPDGVQGGVNRASGATKRASIQVKVFKTKKRFPCEPQTLYFRIFPPVRATDTFFSSFRRPLLEKTPFWTPPGPPRTPLDAPFRPPGELPGLFLQPLRTRTTTKTTTTAVTTTKTMTTTTTTTTTMTTTTRRRRL